MKHPKLLAGFVLTGCLFAAAYHHRSPRSIHGTGAFSQGLKSAQTVRPALLDVSPGSAVTRLKSARSEEIERWLGSLAPTDRDEALSTLAAELAANDPLRAESFARRIVDDSLRAESVSLVYAYRFEKDPLSGLQHLKIEEDSTLHAAIEKRLLSALANSDPLAAANWIAGGEVSADHFKVLLASTIQRWTQQDGPEAGAWIASFEDPTLRSEMANVLVGIWATRDLPEMKEWLETSSRDSNSTIFREAYLNWLRPTTEPPSGSIANHPHSISVGPLSEPCDICAGH